MSEADTEEVVSDGVDEPMAETQTQDSDPPLTQEADDDWDDDDDDDDGDWGDADGDGDINEPTPMYDKPLDTGVRQGTRDALQSNCVEVNMIPLFAAVPDLKSGSRIGALVAIRIDQLHNITKEQLEVWEIPPDYPYIAIKFEFGPCYLEEGVKPKLTVGLSKRMHVEEELLPFRLSWTIFERCNNTMLSNEQWPPKIAMKDIPNASLINDIMESTEKEYAICLKALEKSKMDKFAAIDILCNPKQTVKMYDSIPSLKECGVELQDLLSSLAGGNIHNDPTKKKASGDHWRKSYEGASMATKVKQLMDCFVISERAATLAIEVHGYEGASDALLTPDVRESFVSMAMSEGEAYQNNSTHDRPEFQRVESFFGNFTGDQIPNKQNSGNKRGIRSVLGNLFSGRNKDSSDEKSSLDDSIMWDNAFLNVNDVNRVGNEPMQMYRTQSANPILTIKHQHLLRTIAVMMRHNFLLKVLTYALRVLLNGNRFCMICDRSLAFAGLKPTICTDAFCQFRHDNIGLGFSLASEVIHRGEIIDLLISMCYSATTGNRIQLFFPESVRGLDASSYLDPEEAMYMDTQHFASDQESFFVGNKVSGTQDLKKLKEVLDVCPPIEEMVEYALLGDPELKKYLVRIHCLLYPLISWIITSNRAHIKKLSEKEKISNIDTPFQYALCSATPAREADFQKLQMNNGSFLAFHGSPMGNWHSILRMGLQNYSGTKNQLHGAAHGKGIYFASHFSTSVSYCRHGANNSWPKSMFGPSVSCMALCEICYHDDDRNKNTINKSASMLGGSQSQSPSHSNSNSSSSTITKAPTMHTKRNDPKNRWVKTSSIYVVDQDQYVTTRFFFLFKGAPTSKQLDANSVNIPKVVKRFQT